MLRINNKRRHQLFILSFLLAILFSSNAQANIGLPTIIFVWPAAFFSLPAVIVIEAAVLKRCLSLSWEDSFETSALANLITTLIGTPLACLLSFIPSTIVSSIANAVHRGSFPSWLIGLPLWTFPPDNLSSIESVKFITFGLIASMPAFFACSAVIESIFIRKRLRLPEKTILRSSLFANAWSYAAIVVALLVWAISYALAHPA